MDWQNAYKSARELFGLLNLPNEHGNFSPYQLARVLVAGNGRGDTGQLVRVEIHRGLPSSAKDPAGHGANRRQSAAWMRENSEVVIPRLRPLRYPRTWPTDPPIEKGIDVQLALGVIECLLSGGCDVAVLMSNDTDLVPVVETVARLKGPSAIETASWNVDKTSPRLRPQLPVYHHRASRELFARVETVINYAHHSAGSS